MDRISEQLQALVISGELCPTITINDCQFVINKHPEVALKQKALDKMLELKAGSQEFNNIQNKIWKFKLIDPRTEARKNVDKQYEFALSERNKKLNKEQNRIDNKNAEAGWNKY